VYSRVVEHGWNPVKLLSALALPALLQACTLTSDLDRLGYAGGPDAALGEQPNSGGGTSMPPVVGGGGATSEPSDAGRDNPDVESDAGDASSQPPFVDRPMDCETVTYAQSQGVARQFVFCRDERPWTSALNKCHELDLELATIFDELEYEWVLDQANVFELGEFWLGARDHDKVGEWEWPDGTPLWQGGAPCSSRATVYGNSCYWLTESNSMFELVSNCGAGHVVEIQNALENDFVLSMMGDESELWLGGTDGSTAETSFAPSYGAEAIWRWIETDIVFWEHGPVEGKYNNFLGEPNVDPEDCLYIASDGTWHDGDCGWSGRVGLCEGSVTGQPDRYVPWLLGEPSTIGSCVTSVPATEDDEVGGYDTRACTLLRSYVCAE
jgi:hypothetical protein